MNFITVRAPKGRRVIMPPGLGQTRAQALPEDTPVRIELTPFVQRRIEQGDLVVCPDLPPPEHTPAPDPKPPAEAKAPPAANAVVATPPAPKKEG
jgi:hypothetical protein